jgi:hypothetical protein
MGDLKKFKVKNRKETDKDRKILSDLAGKGKNQQMWLHTLRTATL